MGFSKELVRFKLRKINFKNPGGQVYVKFLSFISQDDVLMGFLSRFMRNENHPTTLLSRR